MLIKKIIIKCFRKSVVHKMSHFTVFMPHKRLSLCAVFLRQGGVNKLSLRPYSSEMLAHVIETLEQLTTLLLIIAFRCAGKMKNAQENIHKSFEIHEIS